MMLSELLYVRLGKVKGHPLSEHLPIIVTHIDGSPDKKAKIQLIFMDFCSNCVGASISQSILSH